MVVCCVVGVVGAVASFPQPPHPPSVTGTGEGAVDGVAVFEEPHPASLEEEETGTVAADSNCFYQKNITSYNILDDLGIDLFDVQQVHNIYISISHQLHQKQCTVHVLIPLGDSLRLYGQVDYI